MRNPSFDKVRDAMTNPQDSPAALHLLRLRQMATFNARLMRSGERDEEIAESRREDSLDAVRRTCHALGVTPDGMQEMALGQMSTEELDELLNHLENHHTWPRSAMG